MVIEFESKIRSVMQTSIVITALAIAVLLVYFLWSLSPKVLGGVFALLGILIIIYFPGKEMHQRPAFTAAGLAIGALLVGFGILLIALG